MKILLTSRLLHQIIENDELWSSWRCVLDVFRGGESLLWTYIYLNLFELFTLLPSLLSFIGYNLVYSITHFLCEGQDLIIKDSIMWYETRDVRCIMLHLNWTTKVCYPGVWLVVSDHMTWTLASGWLRVITWPGHRPLIGWEWSHDLDTGLWFGVNPVSKRSLPCLRALAGLTNTQGDETNLLTSESDGNKCQERCKM